MEFRTERPIQSAHRKLSDWWPRQLARWERGGSSAKAAVETTIGAAGRSQGGSAAHSAFEQLLARLKTVMQEFPVVCAAQPLARGAAGGQQRAADRVRVQCGNPIETVKMFMLIK